MILFRSDAIPRIQHLKNSGNEFYPESIECDDVKSSTESTISTSLIHYISSEGELEQELTWVLNLIFQHENVISVGNVSK